MALGLENSGSRFLWVVRCSSAAAAGEPELEAVLPEGFLERTKERGLVLMSWAPQMEVLSHGAVGGFVTHCGQSSVFEALSFGVPMIAWPLYAEQKFSRVAIVEEMKVALPLEMTADGFVTAAELEKRVRELMESKRGREIRRRVTEMKYSMAAAVGKGGSSIVSLEKFMETVIRS
ncbi:Chalcone 4'-O-glucosyltransferase [Handroanthus impetiginosus]|uniref:Chalcone 4'-O-glucosyltransferase n=1 Tax=Handroanthus impetiginosus TaxID=429701 RepID=A0A2G9GYN4_9LAMI|nr:Chalcone 4'-O-glucosyltransferase [Handroanthus impetiginosus]